MASEIPKINTLFVTYGGAHYKIFNLLHRNFNNKSLMQARFKEDFKKHFEHTDNVQIEYCNSKLDLFFKTIKNLKGKDVVIANCPISGMISYLACLFNNKKRVFLMCQDFYEYFDVSEKKKFRRLFYGNLLKLFIRMACRKSLVIALSNHIKNRAIHYGAERVEIIPVYGIDMNVFKPSKNKIDYNTNKKIILTTARLSPEKGLKFILEAVSNIDTLLVMAGPGNINEVNELISRFNIQDKVRVVGEVDPVKIADYYNSCDLFVLPSIKEGLGFSSGEAMACRKPVVASNTGGIPDMVIHNKTGLLVEPCNVNELRASINKLLSSEELCRKLADNGYDHVRNNYEEEKVVKRFVGVLNNEKK